MTADPILDRLEASLSLTPDTPTPSPSPRAPELPAVDLEGVHESVRAAHSATRKWVGDILHRRTAPYWLTLYGNCGCGKTLLSSHARAFLGSIGSKVEFRNWPRVLEAIYHKDEGVLEQMKNVPVLILDDVGAEYTASIKTSRFSAAKLYLLAEARQGKWTFLTTNLDYSGLCSEIGARFASRVYRNGAEVIDMSHASDYSYEQWKLRHKK